MQEMIWAGICELRAASWQLFAAGPRLIHGTTHRGLRRLLLERFIRGQRHLERLDRIRAAFPDSPDGFSEAVGTWLAELWVSRTTEWSPVERDASTTIAVKHILTYLDGVYQATIDLCELSGREEMAASLTYSAGEVHAAHGPLSRALSEILSHRRYDGDAWAPLATGSQMMLPRAAVPTVAELLEASTAEHRSLVGAAWSQLEPRQSAEMTVGR